MPPPSAAPPPHFFLYGEPPRPADEGFLHLEPLDARSRPSHWRIRPHRHADLNHLFLLSGGGGAMAAGEALTAFEAPCLLLVPAGEVHGFSWRRDSAGAVLTLASGFLAARLARQPALAALFDRAQAIACPGELGALQEVFGRLECELAWRAPGHEAAVEACLLQALVTALRLQLHTRPGPGGEAARDAELVARLRAEVELRFRRHQRIEAYAQALGVSLSRLRHACRRTGAPPPVELVHQRLQREAERGLIYSDMRIAELAFSLGFDDVAYFSRFFRKRAGVSASAWRAREHKSR